MLPAESVYHTFKNKKEKEKEREKLERKRSYLGVVGFFFFHFSSYLKKPQANLCFCIKTSFSFVLTKLRKQKNVLPFF